MKLLVKKLLLLRRIKKNKEALVDGLFMRLIVGLGNPGSRYDGTRHNAGKALAQYSAQRWGVGFRTVKKYKAAITPAFDWNSAETRIAHPETFMNASGESVKAICADLGLNPFQDVLILVDDSSLPFGKLRLRYGGSNGGHNGLKSIEQALLGEDYSRLRLGIGEPAGKPLESYVLEAFTRDEYESMGDVMLRGFEACRMWLEAPKDKAMSAVNGC